MKKEDLIKELEAMDISLALTKDGEMTAQQLALMVQGTKVAGLEKALTAATEARDKAQGMVTALNEQLAAVESQGGRKTESPKFKHEKATYELVIPNSTVIFEKNRIAVNAQSLRDTNGLLAHLIKIQAGCLKLVTNPSK